MYFDLIFSIFYSKLENAQKRMHNRSWILILIPLNTISTHSKHFHPPGHCHPHHLAPYPLPPLLTISTHPLIVPLSPTSHQTTHPTHSFTYYYCSLSHCTSVIHHSPTQSLDRFHSPLTSPNTSLTSQRPTQFSPPDARDEGEVTLLLHFPFSSPMIAVPCLEA